jgi:hypothetical protein
MLAHSWHTEKCWHTAGTQENAGTQLAHSWHTAGTQLAHRKMLAHSWHTGKCWHTAGTQLAHSWHTAGTQLAHSWHTEKCWHTAGTQENAGIVVALSREGSAPCLTQPLTPADGRQRCPAKVRTAGSQTTGPLWTHAMRHT